MHPYYKCRQPYIGNASSLDGVKDSGTCSVFTVYFQLASAGNNFRSSLPNLDLYEHILYMSFMSAKAGTCDFMMMLKICLLVEMYDASRRGGTDNSHHRLLSGYNLATGKYTTCKRFCVREDFFPLVSQKPFILFTLSSELEVEVVAVEFLALF